MPKKIDDFTIEELREAIARKEIAAIPKALEPESYDWTQVVGRCESYMEDLARDGYADTYPIYEAAIETVFGKEVWVWVNDHMC